jgi:catechol 2,3-dioxygenase
LVAVRRHDSLSEDSESCWRRNKVRTSLAKSTLIDRVDRVDLRVRDVERALSFYRDVVGLRLIERNGDRASLGSAAGPALITLDSTGVDLPADRRATGLFHVAIRFPDRSSLGDALARLVAGNLEVGAGDHAVSEALYIDDPDGNGIELYWDRPVELWPAPTEDAIVPMITAPVDLRSLLEEGSGQQAVGDTAPGGTIVGHVHLQVSDLSETLRFYVDEVGLDLTGRLGDQAGFFSSNGYHHHVGANTWSSRNGRPASVNRAGLNRVLFAVTDVDELEALRSRLVEHERESSGTERQNVVVRDPDRIELHFAVR